MDRRFEGRVIIVTGAATGIGHATASRLAQEGASLALVDLESAALAAVRERLPDGTTRADVLPVTADVSDEEQVRSAVAHTLEHYGRIDGLYNNAGIEGEQHPLEIFPTDVFDRVLCVNLKGVFFVMKHVLAHLRTQGAGAIVNAASVGGIRAVPNQVAYVATKHAVAGMTKDAAIEYGQHGVRVNAIAPGAIITDMVRRGLTRMAEAEGIGVEKMAAAFVAPNPMRRFGEPEEVAALVAFLLSDDAKFINGAIVPIDGGQSQAY